MEICVECDSTKLIKVRVGDSEEFEVVCKRCGLVQMSKSDYLESINLEKLEKRFCKMMRSEQIAKLLSLHEEGEKILNIIEQIDDEHHGYVGVAFQMLRDYVKQHGLAEKLSLFLKEN
jgi:uncharacterized C2H2 Zn-finger protein